MKRKLMITTLALAGIISVTEGSAFSRTCYEDQTSAPALEGKVKVVSPGYNSKRAFQMVPAQKRGKWRAVFRTMLPRLAYWGSVAKISVMAKGQGNLRLGMHLLYLDPKGHPCFTTVESPVFPVSSGEWKPFTWETQIVQPGIFQAGTVVISEGEKSILDIDNFQFALQNSGAVTGENTLIEAIAGEQKMVRFTAPADLADLKTFDGVKLAPAKTQDGKIVLQSAPNARQVGVCGKNGGAATTIHYRPRESWEALNDLAKKIKVEKTINVLFIGDSLTDFDRGSNYVDKWAFWVNLHNPGKFKFRNAGVAGDYITTSLNRWKKYPYIFDRFRYEGLEKEKYDYIFFMLGQNDCRKSWNVKEKRYVQLVPPERRKKEFREMLTLLQKHYGAEFIIATPVAGDFERSSDYVKNAVKNGTPHTIFGDPVLLDECAAGIKEVAKEFQAPVVDLLTLSREAKNKKQFYKTDGVHLTREGNDFIAEQLVIFSGKYLK